MAVEAVFLGRDGQQLGPYTRMNLAAMAARGEIRDSDLAWHEELPEWKPATEVLASLGIQRMAAPPPVPPPPPEPPPQPKPKVDERFPGGRRPDGSIHRLGDPEEAPPITDRAGLPAWMQEEVQHLDLYEAFLGPNNKERYLAVFQRFDSGEGNTSWNLAAGLITQLWMLYRGMYLWGLLLYPLLGGIAGGVFGGFVGALFGESGSAIASILWLPASIAITGLYGDKLYHSHAQKMIERSGRLGLSGQARREWLMRKGGTSLLGPIILLVVQFVLIGTLAAIAIPFYQQLVIGKQVLEAEQLAQQAEQSVENYYGSLRAMPMANADVRWPAPDDAGGEYVQSVEIANGTVLVTFGHKADRRLMGKVLAFVPEEGGGGIHWDCATEATTLDEAWRPKQCRN